MISLRRCWDCIRSPLRKSRNWVVASIYCTLRRQARNVFISLYYYWETSAIVILFIGIKSLIILHSRISPRSPISTLCYALTITTWRKYWFQEKMNEFRRVIYFRKRYAHHRITRTAPGAGRITLLRDFSLCFATDWVYRVILIWIWLHTTRRYHTFQENVWAFLVAFLLYFQEGYTRASLSAAG